MFCNILFLCCLTFLSMALGEYSEGEHGESTYEEKLKYFQIPIHKKYAIPIPYPEIVKDIQEIRIPVPQPYQVPFDVPVPTVVETVKNVEINVEKPEPYVVEKQVPFVVEKPYVVFVDKKFPVYTYKPYIQRVPIIKHVYHHSFKTKGWD